MNAFNSISVENLYRVTSRRRHLFAPLEYLIKYFHFLNEDFNKCFFEVFLSAYSNEMVINITSDSSEFLKLNNITVMEKYAHCKMAGGARAVQIIFTEQHFGKVLSLLPRLIPSFFVAKEFELSFFKLLSEEKIDEFMAVMKKWADENLRKNMITKCLTSFFVDKRDSKIRSLEVTIAKHHEIIKNLLFQISGHKRELEQANIELLGLQTSETNNDFSSEIDILSRMNNISLSKDENNNTVFLEIEDTLSLFDDFLAKKLCDGERHPLYNYVPEGKRNLAQKMFKKIFIEGTVKVHIGCAFSIADTSMILPVMDALPHSGNIMPQPHIFHFGCIGEYYEQFAALSEEGDWFGAINTAIASAKSISLSDSAVCNCFSDDLFRKAYKALEYNGEFYTGLELLNLIEKEVEVNEKTENE